VTLVRSNSPRGEVPEMANPPDKKPELFGLRSGTVGFDAR
jgi:hypothetical protein